MNISERWFRLLLRLYPPDFRDDMGDAVVETYRDRARDGAGSGGGDRSGLAARVDARARRLAAQRARRARAARGVVAAQRQLGPRRGARAPPPDARAGVRRSPWSAR